MLPRGGRKSATSPLLRMEPHTAFEYLKEVQETLLFQVDPRRTYDRQSLRALFPAIKKNSLDVKNGEMADRSEATAVVGSMFRSQKHEVVQPKTTVNP